MINTYYPYIQSKIYNDILNDKNLVVSVIYNT